MDNFSNQGPNASQGQSQGNPSQFGSALPPSNLPTPKVDVRTMVSDTQSMKDGGGSAPKPYVPASSAGGDPSLPNQSNAQKPMGASYVPPPLPASQNKSPFSLGSPFGSNVVSAAPPTGNQAPAVSQSTFSNASKNFAPPGSPVVSKAAPMPDMKTHKKGGGGKAVFVVVLTMLIVVGVGAAAYFFVAPLFQKTGGVDNPIPVTENPAPVPENVNTPESIVTPPEPIETTPPPAGSPVLETPSAVTPPVGLAHVSLFKTPADMTNDLSLQEVSLSALRGGITAATAEVPSLQELVLGSNGAVAISALGKALAPSLFSDDFLAFLENDLTFAIYTDSKGTWPVLIVSAKSGADMIQVDAAVKKIESLSADELSNFYLSSPGTASQWKSGSAEGVTTRYNTFSSPGAGLNYGRRGNVVIFSASYAGFKEAVKRISS